jgi:hypothetical protein
MSYDFKLQQELNEKHRWQPEIGDMWDERFIYQAIVLNVEVHYITLCRAKTPVGDDSWTWDLKKLIVMSRANFATLFLYHESEVNKVGAGCWADVNPQKGLEFAKEWKRNQVIPATTATPIRDNYR